MWLTQLGKLGDTTSHPGLHGQLAQPTLNCGDEANVFPHMVFGDVSHTHSPVVAVGDGGAKHSLHQEATKGAVQDGTVPDVRQGSLGAVHEVMDLLIIFRHTTIAASTETSMYHRFDFSLLDFN